jgi:hypothetical protein
MDTRSNALNLKSILRMQNLLSARLRLRDVDMKEGDAFQTGGALQI